MKFFFSLALFTLLSLTAWAGRIDPQTTLIGLEPTFQDQAMVDEPGRMTMATPHKLNKLKEMIVSFVLAKGHGSMRLNQINRAQWKPGYKITLPNKEEVIADMEPVCIEWNQRPMLVSEIVELWTPVYKAAAAVKLVPYVNPVGERSGLGNIHIGGETVADSPFFKHPLLLRNVMVYLHQHPSLLWGFAEAFDIGDDSNIKTYHSEKWQSRFQSAVQEFDQWYLKASAAEKADGTFMFLQILQNQEGGRHFFHHYRYVNLENIWYLAGSTLKQSGHRTGKNTVEFRNSRPFKTPQHAQAMAQMILDILEPLSAPDFTVPFRQISSQEYDRFHSGLVTAEDWKVVKRELNLKANEYLEEMQSEYATYLSSQARPHRRLVDMKIAPAYSPRTEKGTYFELTASGALPKPQLELAGQLLEFTSVDHQGTKTWVAVAKARLSGDRIVLPNEILSGRAFRTFPKISRSCRVVHHKQPAFR